MDWLIDCAIKSSALLLTAFICTTVFMRNSSAARRHLVWVIAAAGALAMPGLRLALPAWHTLPDWKLKQDVVVDANEPAAEQTPATRERPALRLATVGRPTTGVPMPGVADTSAIPIPEPLAVVNTPAPAQPAMQSPLLQWANVYWIGTAIFCLPLLLGSISLYRLKRVATPVSDPAWLELLAQLAAQLKLTRPVRLIRTPCRAMPMTWGILPGRPATILIPEDADDWSPDRRQAVLLHELAHIKRQDCRTQLLAQLARALHWYNPLIWYAHRMMTIERERACDDLVLGHGHHSDAYAQHIFEIAAGPRAGRFNMASGIPMARKSHLSQRLRAILDAGQNRRTVTKLVLLLTVLVALAIVLPIAAMREKKEAAEANVSETAWPERGKVVDGSGNPVAGARVMQDDTEWSAITDSNGEFRFPPPLLKTFIATADGYEPAQLLVSVQGANRQPYLSSHVIEIHKFNTVSGVVIGFDGRPVKAARFAAMSIEQPYRLGNFAQSTTRSHSVKLDADGRFTINKVLPGAVIMGCVVDDATGRRIGLKQFTQQDGETLADIVIDLRESTHQLQGTVVDLDGVPVPHAAVEFTMKSDGSKTSLRMTDVFPVQADDMGYFNIDNIPPGNWEITGTYQGRAWGEGVKVTIPQSMPSTLTVPVRRNADGFFRLVNSNLNARQAVLEWIAATLEGDTAGAAAYVLPNSEFEQHADDYRELLTRPSGENDFSTYTASVSPPHNDVIWKATAPNRELPDGTISDLIFRLRKSDDLLRIEDVAIHHGPSLFETRFERPPSDPSRGRVVDGKGNPVAGATVQAEDRSWRHLTDQHGEFPFPVDAAPHTIEISASGFGLYQAYYDNRPLRSAPSRRVFTIHRLGSIGGQVIGRDGQPVGEVRVSASFGWRSQQPYPLSLSDMRYVRTDADGRFKFDRVLPGTVLLGCAATYDDANVIGLQSLRMPEGRVVDDVVIDLRQSTHTVEGVVLDADGQPLPHGQVGVVVSGPLGVKILPIHPALPLASDSHGRFRIENVPAGRFDLGGMSQEGIGAPVSVDFAAGKAIELMVHADQASGRFRPSIAVLHGKIVDASENPVPNVTITGKSYPWTAITDAAGNFALPPLAPNEFFSFASSADGYVPRKDMSVTISFPFKEPSFEIHRFGSITGRLLDTTGQPIVGEQVWAGGRERYPSYIKAIDDQASTVTDANGTFVLQNAWPGTVLIRYSPESRRPAAYRVLTLADGQNVTDMDIDLALSRYVVEGVVRDADGKPLQGAHVTPVAVLPNDDQWAIELSAVTDNEGRFRIDQLQPGKYYVTAHLPITYVSGKVEPFEIVSDNPEQIDITIPVQQSPHGNFRRRDKLGVQQQTREWLLAWQAEDHEWAAAQILPDSPMAEHVEAYASVWSQLDVSRLTNSSSERGNGTGSATTDATVKLPDGRESRLHFQFIQRDDRWLIEDVLLEERSSLFSMPSSSPPPAPAEPVPDVDSSAAPAATTESAYTPLTAALSNGATVEVVGLSTNPADDDLWWRPDGSAFPDSPRGQSGSLVYPDEHQKAYEIGLRVSNLQPNSYSIQMRFMPASDIVGHGQQPVHRSAFKMPIEQRQFNLQVGIAGGEWTTVTEFIHGGSDSLPDGTVILRGQPIAAGENTSMTVTHNIPPDRYVRLVAIDNNGVVHTAPGRSDGSVPWMMMQTSFNLTMDSIQAFQVQSSPYEWIEFRNISLEPDHTTQPVGVLASDE